MSKDLTDFTETNLQKFRENTARFAKQHAEHQAEAARLSEHNAQQARINSLAARYYRNHAATA